jgi:GTP cyclohydrolase IA
MTSAAMTNGAHVVPVGRVPHLRLARDVAPVDLDAAADAIRRLLTALGQDVESPHLRETPRRVAAAYAELLTPEPFALTTFPNDAGHDELVLVRDVPFRSLCEHHLLPFHGVAHIGYLPADRIAGLSKLARVVEHYARGLQVQERLTGQIADCLEQNLRANGVAVVLEAEHLCMSVRGVRAAGARTITSALRGLHREHLATRQEFFQLIGARP